MTIYLLSEDHLGFPDPALADDDGLLAVGGDLSPPRLSLAYSQGIFPWYGPGSPILWWSPNPRMVLFPEELHVSASLRRTLNSGRFRITLDRAFEEVIAGCAVAERPEQDGTWLVPEMVRAYCRLHRKGLAHSAEAWCGDELAGGVYGVALGRAFFAESMYYSVSDASKNAFVYLVGYLRSRGFSLIDCQQSTAHSARFGAREIPRREFFSLLRLAVASGERPEIWELPEGFHPLRG
jgi:leucyl/phenylalanyl-tRNA--protein transferase